MKQAAIIALWLAVIGLMVASYASIIPSAIQAVCPSQQNDGYVEGIPHAK